MSEMLCHISKIKKAAIHYQGLIMSLYKVLCVIHDILLGILPMNIHKIHVM